MQAECEKIASKRGLKAWKTLGLLEAYLAECRVLTTAATAMIEARRQKDAAPI